MPKAVRKPAAAISEGPDAQAASAETLSSEDMAALKIENDALTAAEDKPSLGNKFLDWQRDSTAGKTTEEMVAASLPSAVKKTKATAARQKAAEKHKAEAKALREAKAQQDAETKGQPTAGQLAVIAEREQKKAATEAVIAQKSAFLESLEPFAKEINHRFELATQLDGKADDHRLAASLKLAEARALCDANHVRFKDWAAQHVREKNYEYVLRLAKVGAAEDPKLALADMRSANAERNKAHRAKHKTVRQRSEVIGGLGGTVTVEGTGATDGEYVADAAGAWQPAKKLAQATGVAALKLAFAALKAAEQMEFVGWAAAEVGALLDFDIGDAAEHGSATAEAQFLNQQSA